MIRAGIVSLALCATACSRSQGVPDEDLGGLVIETKKPDPPIEVDRAAKQPGELGRALMRPHHAALAAIGPHTVQVATTTTVEEAGKPVSDLTDHATLEIGAAGSYHGVYTNSADYGRETIFIDAAGGGTLYLRPRYQAWHARPPESSSEPAAIRDGYFEAVAATWDLFAPAAELTDLGPTQAAGRAGRKIEVKLSPTPRTPEPERLTQRKWRELRTIEELVGEVVLDAGQGVPLSVKLTGALSFQRDGRRFRMKLSVQSSFSAIGLPAAITAPAEAEVVAIPERLREVDDRDQLLEGIAPPLRKTSDGIAPPPRANGKAGNGILP